MTNSRLLTVLCLFSVALFHASSLHAASSLEITTKSPQARAEFLDGLEKMGTLHREPALESWRAAAKADPDFALVHAFLAMLSRDPVEQVAERERALATRKSAGPEGQLIIDWVASASQSRWVPAIQAMNEALRQYPRDKYLAWLAGLWLTNQRQSEHAIKMFERATKLDAKFADPWNQAAYCYARLRNYDKAFTYMKRYSELLPQEANPLDSLAEISRMAGRFDDALKYYHASLKIDPTFIDSQAGLGDTYALMGDQVRARAEYAGAIAKAATRVQSVTFALQSAATYAREQDFAQADAAYKEAAQLAHSKDLGTLEAEAWRRMSVYQKDNARAMELMAKSEAVLHEEHKMSPVAREQELALILRTRSGRAVHDGNMPDARASLRQLKKIAATNNSGQVQFALHGAEGAILMAQGKFEQAITSLEEDDKNPFSMQRLIVAYTKTGKRDAAARMSQTLARYYEPTIEQAVVVPEFNKGLVAMKDKN